MNEKYRYVNYGFWDDSLGEDGAFRRDITAPLHKLGHGPGPRRKQAALPHSIAIPLRRLRKHAEGGDALAPLYFDIDNPDLEEARTSALNLVNQLPVPERYVEIYFSGNKGFHVEIPPEVFDLEEMLPDEKAAYAYKNIAKEMKQDVAPDIDLAVYEPKRLWRVVNSKHEKTGLYKVPVTQTELKLLSPGEIREVAESPRPDIYRDREAEPVEEMQELYEEYREQDPRNSIPDDEEERRTVTEPIIEEETPCIESLLRGVDEGERNEAAIRLASALNNMDYSKERALTKLEGWNTRNSPSLPNHEIRNTVASAYGNQYNYGCRDHLLERYCVRDKCSILDE